jgi:hypothetical protein
MSDSVSSTVEDGDGVESAVDGAWMTNLSNVNSGCVSNLEPIDSHRTSGYWTTAQMCLQGSFLVLKSTHWHDCNCLSEPSHTWYLCPAPWTINNVWFCCSISEGLIPQSIFRITCSTTYIGRLCRYFGTHSS